MTVQRTLVLPFAVLLSLAGCHRNAPTATAPTPAPALTFTSPSGKVYTRVRVAPPDNDEPINNIFPNAVRAPPDLDSFVGVARKAAKISVAPGVAQSFTDLGDVLDSLPSDASMRALNISKAANSGRLPQEEKLVVVTAFLYASSRESDNDFHCIVGRDPGSRRAT